MFNPQIRKKAFHRSRLTGDSLRRARTSVIPGTKYDEENPDGKTCYYLITEGIVWGPEFESKKDCFKYLKSNFKKILEKQNANREREAGAGYNYANSSIQFG